MLALRGGGEASKSRTKAKLQIIALVIGQLMQGIIALLEDASFLLDTEQSRSAHATAEKFQQWPMEIKHLLLSAH